MGSPDVWSKGHWMGAGWGADTDTPVAVAWRREGRGEGGGCVQNVLGLRGSV